MPGLVPGIHVFAVVTIGKTWMAGTSPAMTKENPPHRCAREKEHMRASREWFVVASVRRRGPSDFP
jgi:hypothetical protein